ncbi:MAG: L-threonylcarbamoyladenylate synthase [Oscillospiraceae bacterium]|nr:L-threonylcarbamoyladenylate synthase [Oscillospiraceae bacterium]
MNTIIKKADETSIAKAVELLQSGEIVAIPTETVYGLAANALNSAAIEKIFAAKGRPRDNPLIVHVTDLEMAKGLGLEIPAIAEELAEKFWAGPLTMIFRRTVGSVIPEEISCGLDTAAVRVPNNPAALEIIRHCGVPLAAPSANVSGSPSPTKAGHVFADLNGKIPLIIDGGTCSCGVESTVIAFEDDKKIRILRPGAVTAEELGKFAEIIIDEVVLGKNKGGGSPPRSPGTAYKHYSPKAEVIAVIAESGEEFAKYVDANKKESDFKLTFSDYADQGAKILFAKLRELDEFGAKRIFVRLPKPEGIGLAVYNRLVRAAEFNVVRLS